MPKNNQVSLGQAKRLYASAAAGKLWHGAASRASVGNIKLSPGPNKSTIKPPNYSRGISTPTPVQPSAPKPLKYTPPSYKVNKNVL
jgi:hypothetical protein